MAPVGGKARVGRGQDGCRESRSRGGCITWIYLNPKMGVFWSEIQLTTWSTCEVVGNEAGGALRGLRAQLRSPDFLLQTLGSHGRLLSKGVSQVSIPEPTGSCQKGAVPTTGHFEELSTHQ